MGVSKSATGRTKTIWMKIFYAAGAGLLLCVLSWLAILIPYNFAFEETQLSAQAGLLRLMRSEPAPLDSFLFIDVSKNKKLVPFESGEGQELQTDRDKLRILFETIAKQSTQTHRSIVCDIIFDKPGKSDQRLEKALLATKDLLIPYGEVDGVAAMPVFEDVPRAYAGYDVSRGPQASSKFLKYRLWPGSDKTIPWTLFERWQGVQGDKHLGFIWLNGRAYMQNLIPEIRMMPDQLIESGGNRVLPLGEVINLLLANDSLFYEELLANKHIYIGDFSTDLHDTYAGTMPGTLILANLYWSVREGDGRVSFGWLLFLWVAFSLVSYFILYPPEFLEKRTRKMEQYWLGMLLLCLLSLTLLFWLVSFLSWWWFSKPLDIVFVTLAFTIWVEVRAFLNRNKNKS